LQRKGYAGKTIGIKLRYDDFQSLTRDLTVALATDDPARIRQIAGQCLKRAPLTKRLRLLGVRVAALQRQDAEPKASEAPSVSSEMASGSLFLDGS
jgi:DNA polymerase-4